MRKDSKIVLIFLIITLFVLKFYNFPSHIFNWDSFGYYLYLPATFIYDDLKLLNQEWIYNIIEKYETTATFYQAYRTETGNWVIRYTLGNAIVISPFFFLAHIFSLIFGFPADGFSAPYKAFVSAGGIIYAAIGLIYLRKILRNYFDDKITILCLIIIFFGTNYTQLTIDGTFLTHNFLFSFYAILVYYTIQWHENKKVKHISIIALSVGMITIIRPTEAICILIPLLWNIKDINSLQKKAQLLNNNINQIALAAVILLICVLPQLLYWHYITDKFIIDSYNYAGEGLDFLSPHIGKFLFHFRKGWFIYTPIMIFSMIGFYYLYKENRKVFWAILIFFVIDLYVISSWSVWWYSGASFSQRAIVPAYVILAIPLGYFIKSLLSYSRKIKIAFFLLGIFLIALNVFQWWQFKNDILSFERMTKEYYLAIFGKTSVTEKDKELLLVERSVGHDEELKNEKDYSSKIIYFNDFSERNDTTDVFIMNENKPYSPGPDIMFKDLTSTDHAWIRAKAKIFIPENYNEELPVLVATFHYKGRPYKYKGKSLNLDEITFNNWNEITFDYLSPEVRSEDDNLKVYVWHRGKTNIYLDELKVEAFVK